MRIAFLLLGGLLAAAGAASAIEVLDVVYENTSALAGCISGSVQGNAGVGLVTDGTPEGTSLQVSAPFLAPPSPTCLVLPGV